MQRKLRKIDPFAHFTDEVTLDALGSTLTWEKMDRFLKKFGVSEQRKRKLPLTLVTLLVIAMCLFTEPAIEDVLAKLTHGPRFLRPAEDIVPASKGAISQRRQQLGVAPLAALYHEICQPLATEQTPDAFLFGMRLMAIDPVQPPGLGGTIEDVADTPENARYFGRVTGGRGAAAFPQVQAVYLCECGTHAICDAGFWPCAVSERKGALRMLRSVKPGMLVMWDRGLHSYEMCLRCHKGQKAHFLSRLPAHVQPPFAEFLPDGSYPAYLRPSDRTRRKQGEHLLVRVIEYILDDPNRPGHSQMHRLVTSLLDAQRYPAKPLACAYHARWEVEITIDEIDTHQRQLHRPLRSRTPLGVLQELYGLLIAHYAVRALMHQAAQQAQLPPDRLSFVKALRIIHQAVFEFQVVAPKQTTQLFAQLLSDLARAKLPERDNRSNPRVVKRKMSNFRLKRAQHHNWPQPTKEFADAIVILNKPVKQTLPATPDPVLAPCHLPTPSLI